MSEALRKRLQILQEDYPGQPLLGRQADLVEINSIRSQLGMPPVDAQLQEVGSVAVSSTVAAVAPPPLKADHSEAREIYRAYLEKLEVLEQYREYAQRVARATHGLGMTPVKPLATMGTDGGPLLCDHCHKPIILEGGEFHNVPADVAWKRNPVENWQSWIYGGMVVEIQMNGTLRIYHGYPGRGNGHCCNQASRQLDKAMEEFGKRRGGDKRGLLIAFIQDEFPKLTEAKQRDLLNDILNVMYGFDPGLGINQPPAKK